MEFFRRHGQIFFIICLILFLRLKEAREKSIEDQYILVEFTDEEGFGRYLDLHEAYTQFINLKNIEQVDYLTYLLAFDRLFDIPKERKNHEYKKYLNTLLDYLYSFIQRAKPLLNIEEELQNATKEFEGKFESGNFPGWPKEAGSALAHSGKMIPSHYQILIRFCIFT